MKSEIVILRTDPWALLANALGGTMKMDTGKIFKELKRFCSWGEDSRRNLTALDIVFTIITITALFIVVLIFSKFFGW
jgi:hypothetical protein